MKKTLLALGLSLLLTPAAVFGQETAFGNAEEQEVPQRRVGLSAGLQGSDLNIYLPVFLSRQFAIAPAVGFTYAEGIGSDLTLALVPKYYFSNKRFMPFVGTRFGLIMNRPAETNTAAEENRKDYFTGLGFGAEYFLGSNFSFGVEAQGNFTFSDENSSRFGNPGGTNFNLGSVVTANIYFLR